MGFFTEEIAIDLGTANTLIIHNDKVVVDSPSIVAIDRTTNKVIAIGQEANMMQGKTHENIRTVRPLKDGVIADFNASEQMINMLIKSIPSLKRKFFSPSLRMVICIPSGITEVEMRAVKESAERVNGKEVYLIHEPMAAAIGIGIDIMQPKGNMIVDIGGGTTEIAVISMGDIVNANSVRVGGEDMTDRLIEWLRAEHSMLVDEGIAESLKHAVGSAYQFDKEPQVTVTGRDIVKGVPKQVLLEASDVRQALSPVVQEIIEAVRVSLSQTPPALVSDIDKYGAWLTGGGSLLKQIDRKIAEDLGIPINMTEDPLSTVVVGSGICLERFADYKSVLKSSPKPN